MYRRHIIHAAIVGFLVFPALLTAQSGNAELFGTVRDPAGLAVAGARVTAEEIATKWKSEVGSSPSGAFHFAGLRPGGYHLKVQASGFAPFERTGLRLPTGGRIPVEVRLELAGISGSVEVRADAALLDSGSGAVGHVVERESVNSLPLDGRNFIPLIATLPGVALPRGSAFPRLNGSRPRTNEYIYDGISVLQPEPGQVAYYPIVDAIEEFRVDLNSYSAEFGRSNGGVIQVRHKSGGNELHGSLFEFFRHERLNARNLFAPEGNKPQFRRNQFGFVAGGPIRRNRTFFFGEYQGTRLRTGRTLISTVPTSLQREGVFSEPSGGRVPQIFDPATTAVVDGRVRRDLFPNATVPRSRFDPAAIQVLERYPLPNQAFGGLEPAANNFRRDGSEAQRQDQFGIRIDHDLTGGQRLFARYARFVDDTAPVAPLPDGSGLITRGAIGNSATASDAVVAEHSWTIGPHAFHQARFGYTRRRFRSSMLRVGRDAAGVPNLPANSFGDALPVFAIDGYQQIGPTANANGDFKTSVTQLVDTLSLIRGGHSLKMGADLRWQTLDMLQPADPSGRFHFTAPFTGLPGSPDSGHALASMLLGQVESFHIDLQPDTLRPRARNAEFYVQDDWRAAGRLTINVGLRYTLNFPSTEKNGRAAVFDLDQEELEFLGADGNPRAARELKYGNLGPRFGLAYRVTDTFAARAGYGLSWFEMAGITTPFTTPFFPFIQSVGKSSLDNIAPAFKLGAGPSVVPIGAGPDAGLGQGVFGVDRGNGSGYMQQWNLTLQKTFGNELSFEAGYLGSKITRLGVPDGNVNQLTAEQLALGPELLERVENPFFGEIPAESSLGGPTITRAQLLAPHPRFTSVSLYRNNIGQSIYHAFQASLERRLNDGLTFRLAYTFSKLIDDASSVFSASALTGPVANFPIADSHNRRAERDVSRGDIPHVFAASFVYDLPGPAARGWRGALLGGWRIAGIGRVQSGIPVPVEQQPNFNSFAGFGSQRPNRVSDPRLPSGERTTARYFATDAFVAAPQFQLGNSGRNPVRGPGWRTLDLMLGKTFRAGERLQFEWRVEAFNVTNTPPWNDPNGNFGTPGFGSITGAGDPRVYEFVLKAHF